MRSVCRVCVRILVEFVGDLDCTGWKWRVGSCSLVGIGISWDTSEEHLKEYFQSFGEVIEVVIMNDRTTGRARGFGFVVFSDPAVAEKVVKEKHMINGRSVSCYMLKYD
ncbi:putative RNA recognition motif domain, nucleotide-binding alpha-beta plait domain superfamily [Helianthus annuus]|nr:putative RNA recognition motif domain, nucleotide-binding alpha-beta plait domain superfamily [Helianthus annuus]